MQRGEADSAPRVRGCQALPGRSSSCLHNSRTPGPCCPSPGATAARPRRPHRQDRHRPRPPRAPARARRSDHHARTALDRRIRRPPPHHGWRALERFKAEDVPWHRYLRHIGG